MIRTLPMFSTSKMSHGSTGYTRKYYVIHGLFFGGAPIFTKRTIINSMMCGNPTPDLLLTGNKHGEYINKLTSALKRRMDFTGPVVINVTTNTHLWWASSLHL